MTVFLIFICALLMMFTLVLWGLGMVALRLAPLYIMHKRRKGAYYAIRADVEGLARQVVESNARVEKLEARILKYEEEAINEALNTRARR